MDRGVRERPPRPGVRCRAFVDPASGERKGNDSFGFGLSHEDGDLVVLDVVRWWAPPFSPAGVIEEIAALLKAYDVSTVEGDRYGPGYVSAFRDA